MEWNWLLGLIYGAFGGFFEFLPVSPRIHQEVLLKLTGAAVPGYGMLLAVHLGALAAVIVSYHGTVGKLMRERKIASQPKRKRNRQPDVVSLMQLRLLRVAVIPLILSGLCAPWVRKSVSDVWLIALLTVFCGIVVLLPNYMSRANKDTRSLSPLDATLFGLGGMLGVIPGFSRMGTLTAVASMRGADRQFALEFTYLLSIPTLIALCLSDIGMLIFAGDPLASVLFIPGMMACIAAFAVGTAGIRFMRFLAVKGDYENFAYYSWGIALFAFVIYLIG